MSDAGDLHWKFIEAGRYQTDYWANGYKYRVMKDNYGNWTAEYTYDKWTDAKWKTYKKLGAGFASSHDTMKVAKRACLIHNLHPRRKFKFLHRITKAEAGNSRIMQHYIGYLLYRELNSKGEELKWSNYYMNPDQIIGEKKCEDCPYEGRCYRSQFSECPLGLKVPTNDELNRIVNG